MLRARVQPAAAGDPARAYGLPGDTPVLQVEPGPSPWLWAQSLSCRKPGGAPRVSDHSGLRHTLVSLVNMPSPPDLFQASGSGGQTGVWICWWRFSGLQGAWRHSGVLAQVLVVEASTSSSHGPGAASPQLRPRPLLAVALVVVLLSRGQLQTRWDLSAQLHQGGCQPPLTPVSPSSMAVLSLGGGPPPLHRGADITEHSKDSPQRNPLPRQACPRPLCLPR